MARRMLVAAVGLGALLGPAAASQAEFGIVPGTFTATSTDSSGSTLTQAGAHPDASTSFTMNSRIDQYGSEVPDEDLKEVKVDLPVGVVGNPTGAPRCLMQDFNSVDISPHCSPATQVGIVTIDAAYNPGQPKLTKVFAVYNLTPAGGTVAQFGFRIARNNVLITAHVRSDSDYGISATLSNIPSGVQVFSSRLTFWGVPADPIHDALRFRAGADDPGDINGGPLPANVTPVAFFTNPTACDGSEPVTRIAMRSWQHPDTWVTTEAKSPPVVGCDRLLFEPSLTFQPELAAAASPSSYRVRIDMAQNDDPNGLAAPALRNAVVSLPPGVLVSPSSASGLQGCTPEQIGLKALGDATCPAASTIGTVSIKTPLLSEPLTGSVFLASPTKQQLLRIYLYAKGSGVTVKVAGNVNPDPVTGQLTAVFEDNPQLPVSSIELLFKGGARAPLVNPRSCGPVQATANLTPWNTSAVTSPTDAFTVSADGHGAACPDPGFAPNLLAGTLNPVAGVGSTFELSFSRTDREQYLKSTDLNLPNGLTGLLSSVNLCPEAAAAAGTCDESSRIGSILTKAGPGITPLELPGRAYMTGPYNGAPLGMAFVVPAVAGPFDLGTVVVRAAVFIDRTTAALRVVSDPLPTILQGIPLQIRTVKVSVDRSGFILNPTNCSAGAIAGAISGMDGGVAGVSAKFRASECAALPYKPKMALRVGTARKHTKKASVAPSEMRDGGHPPLSFHLEQPAGQANNKKATVTLPLALALDPDNANGLCEPSASQQDACPKSSIVGEVHARSPLLNGTLDGPVYFVRGEVQDAKTGRIRKTLPKLYVPLSASAYPGVKVDLRASSDVKADQLVTTFDNLPDVPVSSFDLEIYGGKHGILVVSNANMCSTGQYMDGVFVGQNGRTLDNNQGIETQSCPLAIVGSSHSTTSLNLRLGGLAPGKVSVTAPGMRKRTKSVAATETQDLPAEGVRSQAITATTNASLSLRLSRGMRSRLAHGSNVRVRVAVSFTPKGSRKATKTSRTLTIHGTRAKK
jgi:hypothetical protein